MDFVVMSVPTLGKIADDLEGYLDGELVSNPIFPLWKMMSKDPNMKSRTYCMGVYIIFYKGIPFYIGKSNCKKPSKAMIRRLRQHYSTLIDYNDIESQTIPLDNLPLILAAELMLVLRFTPCLNGTDFGSGHDYERSKKKDRPKRKHWRPTFERFRQEVDCGV